MVVLHCEGIAVAVSAAKELLLVVQVFESAADRLVGVHMVLKGSMISLEELCFVHPLPFDLPFGSL